MTMGSGCPSRMMTLRHPSRLRALARAPRGARSARARARGAQRRTAGPPMWRPRRSRAASTAFCPAQQPGAARAGGVAAAQTGGAVRGGTARTMGRVGRAARLARRARPRTDTSAQNWLPTLPRTATPSVPERAAQPACDPPPPLRLLHRRGTQRTPCDTAMRAGRATVRVWEMEREKLQVEGTPRRGGAADGSQTLTFLMSLSPSLPRRRRGLGGRGGREKGGQTGR